MLYNDVYVYTDMTVYYSLYIMDFHVRGPRTWRCTRITSGTPEGQNQGLTNERRTVKRHAQIST